MSAIDDLQYSIHKLFKKRENAYATHAGRRDLLNVFSKDLIGLGFSLRNIKGLKQKHIYAVVEHWKDKDLAVPTIKNRLAALRTLCKKINKKNLIPTNKQLKIGKRTYIPKRNRAINNPDFSKITNPYIRISLELQRVFGLRREESLKIKPYLADKGERLELMPTWCKNGRSRIVPIQNAEQRYWLEQAKSIAGRFDRSLIPQGKQYIQQRHVYDKQVNRAGLRNLHGLRHAYAQKRYKELTGWNAPINGGVSFKKLTKQQKKIDFEARIILSEELGHSRKQITVAYLSR